MHCVYVASHPRHHASNVEEALWTGKHVFCEPPLALNVAQAERLQRLAESSGCMLAVNYQQRFDPALLLLRHWLHDHALGDLVGGIVRNTTLLPVAQQSWRVDPQWGGIALDRTLRTVDAIRFLTGDEAHVTAATRGPRAFGHDEPPAQGAPWAAGDHRPRATPTAIESLHGLFTLNRTGAAFSTMDSYLLPHVPARIELYGSAGSAALDPWQSDSSSTLTFYSRGEVLSAADATPAADLWSATVAAVVTAVETNGAAPAPAAEDIANLAQCLALLDLAGGPAPE